MRVRTRKQKLAFYKSHILIAIKGIFWKRAIKDIRIMLLTIGFPSSGSSLLGCLLTAHPNIVVADEPRVSLRRDVDGEIKVNDTKYPPDADILYEADDLNAVFNYILEVDYQRLQNKKRIKSDDVWSRAYRYVVVPNQYQGCFKKLEVIGVKRSQRNIEILSNSDLLSNLKNKLEKRGITLKFILTARNPYDIVSTTSQFFSKINLEKSIKNFNRLCNKNTKLLQRIDPQDIFICRHEDTLKDLNRQLTKLCDFLQVPVPPNYLDDCASQVIRKPHQSRLKVDWAEEQKQRVASLIEKYDFLSGYNWES